MSLMHPNFAHLWILAALAMLASWFWYSPRGLGGPWMRALKMERRAMDQAQRRRLGLLLLEGLLSCYVRALVLDALVRAFSAQTLIQGMEVGLLAWLGFTLTASLDTLWEGRPGTVLLINNALWAFIYACTGGALAVWH